MRYLLDTGIIARLVSRSDPEHLHIRDALRVLAGKGHAFVCARQNVVEFWSLSTRPATSRGGFRFDLQETARNLGVVERVVTVRKEPDSTYAKWKSLVIRYGVCGRQAHDARIVAVMLAYRVRRILTLNESDFARYREIEAVSPAAVIKAKHA